MLAGSDDTIVAAATPAGRGAIAVVRLSGARALDIGAQVVAPWPVTERRATLCDLRDPADASLIDRGVVTVYRAPRSYTGEDLVEFSTHGGRIVPTVLAGVLLRAGAREALPGEFTRRALLNGKMDLTQAEAVGDLVDARTDAMRRASLYQVSGGLSRTIAKLRDSVLDLEAMLAYDIDFPEEDDGPIARTRVSAAAREVVGALDLLMRSANLARVVRDGASVVIAGAPNVGKSSLFNALLGQNRAIVTAEPGTTRDAIEQLVETAGWPLRLVDTAGLRDGADLVERLGIEVSERHARAADVVLVCGDSLPALADARQRIASLTGAPLILVRTKADLPEFGDEVAAGDAVVSVSARSSQGLDVLLQAIVGTLQEHCGSLSDMTPLLSHARQQLAVERALSELGAFQAAWENDSLPAPVSAVHVRSAAVALDEIIGAVGVDDVLDRVFARFCVGK